MSDNLLQDTARAIRDRVWEVPERIATEEAERILAERLQGLLLATANVLDCEEGNEPCEGCRKQLRTEADRWRNP